MKLKKGFIVHDTGSESILVPMGGAGWSGVVKGNRTLSFQTTCQFGFILLGQARLSLCMAFLRKIVLLIP